MENLVDASPRLLGTASLSPLGYGCWRLVAMSEQDALAQRLAELAKREGVNQSAIALAFVLAHPSRPVALVGSISPQRIADAAQALSVHLDRADVYGIIQVSMGESLP